MKLTKDSWMSKTSRTLAVLVLLAPPIASAQLDAFSDEVKVRVVNVDVVVTDRDDRLVTGLAREDFELQVDGEPVEISHFAELGTSQVGIVPAPSDPRAPRASFGSESRPRSAPDQHLNLVVYLDRAFVGPGDLQDLGIALRRFFDTGLRPDDRVMLVSADRKLEVLQELTNLTDTIDSLLAEGLAKTGRGQRIESEFRDVLRSIDQALTDGNDLNSRLPGLQTQALLTRINAFSAEAYREVATTQGQLRQMITAVSGLPGRNVVLYVGGRLPIQAGQTLFSAWERSFGRNSTRWQTRRPAPGIDSGGGASPAPGTPMDMFADGLRFDAMSAPDSNLDAAELFETVARHAGALGVRFYTLDATAQRASAETALSRGSRALASETGGSQIGYRESQRVATAGALAELAETSGGRALGTGRDFARLFEDMRRDLEAIYSLGFVPAEEDEGRVHRIEVKLRAPSVKRPRLRYRQYYQSLTADQEAAEKTLSALLVGAAENPLRVEVSAEPESEPAAGGRRRIPLSIKVPLANLALVAEERSHVGKLTLFVTSGDLDRGAAPVRRAEVPVRIANQDILNVLGRHLEYTLEVEVAQGSRTIAVGVRDDFAPLLSTVTLAVAGSGPAAPESGPAAPAGTQGPS